MVDCGALDALVICLEEFDPGVKEAAAWALGYIARHNDDLAQVIRIFLTKLAPHVNNHCKIAVLLKLPRLLSTPARYLFSCFAFRSQNYR